MFKIQCFLLVAIVVITIWPSLSDSKSFIDDREAMDFGDTIGYGHEDAKNEGLRSKRSSCKNCRAGCAADLMAFSICNAVCKSKGCS